MLELQKRKLKRYQNKHASAKLYTINIEYIYVKYLLPPPLTSASCTTFTEKNCPCTRNPFENKPFKLVCSHNTN